MIKWALFLTWCLVAIIGYNNVQLSQENDTLRKGVYNMSKTIDASDDLIAGLMTRVDELEGANEALVGLEYQDDRY